MPQERCRVLIIDDHEDTSEMLKLLLGEEDYEVKIAVTVKEALHLATNEKFDLYVLDKHLPDGSGLELFDNWAAFATAHPTYRIAPGTIPFMISDWPGTYVVSDIDLR